MALAVLAAAAPPLNSGAANDAKLEAYGRHLARECTSCHRVDGIDTGIPSIVGWPPDMFVTTMKFYREGSRTNPVMVSVASSLTDEQLKALAAFFATVPKPAPKAAPPTQIKTRK
ncbi:MAG: hypothetical protein K2X43_22540 [Hyphomonadaceae bacterium]|nr:hypothetical protein [Hyphomonadaceae bacterium]